MLMLIPRFARPDAAYWPGRRALAAVDAMAWPLAWVAVLVCVPFDTGLMGRFAMAVALVSVVPRLYRALWRNERYWFTTWRWGRPLVVLTFVAAAMKVAVLVLR